MSAPRVPPSASWHIPSWCDSWGVWHRDRSRTWWSYLVPSNSAYSMIYKWMSSTGNKPRYVYKNPSVSTTQRYLAATELGKKISILSAVLNYHFGKLSRAQILLLVMHLISIKHAILSHLVLSSRTWMASAKQQHRTTSVCSSSTHYPGHHNCTSMFILFNSSSLG